jgi:hypothetical protein
LVKIIGQKDFNDYQYLRLNRKIMAENLQEDIGGNFNIWPAISLIIILYQRIQQIFNPSKFCMRHGCYTFEQTKIYYLA